MQASTLATTLDYEAFAKEVLDMQTFEHLQGAAISRPKENTSDFDLIKLKARGLLSLSTFKGPATTILGQSVQSPVMIGPLPAIHDVKLCLNDKDVKAGAAIKSVCDKLGLLSVVPIEQTREVIRDTETKNPFMLYVVPDQAVFPKQVALIKHVMERAGEQVAGIVLECGYKPQTLMAEVDKRNRYRVPERVLQGSPKPWTKCNFKFAMIPFLKKHLQNDLPVVVRGIATIDDALKAAENGASGVWLTELCHFKSAASPISITHSISTALKELHPGCEVIVQGGVRRGTDLLKGLALGAKGVALDVDTVLWGLVRDGNSQGLEDMLKILDQELRLAMILTHSRTAQDVTADRVIEWVQPKAHQWRIKL